MTRINLAKAKANRKSLLYHALALGAALVLAQLLVVKTAEAKRSYHRRVVKGANASLKGKRSLHCSSLQSAPVYLGLEGQWVLKGQVVSDFTIKNLSLKTPRRRDLGSNQKMASYDSRIADERVFQLKPDPFCNYEVNFPRDFSGEKRFSARLVQTCDNLFDGTAELSCSLR